MRGFTGVLFFLLIFHFESLSGQCPDRDSLWKNIKALRYSASGNYDERLKKLLQDEKQVKACPYNIDSVYTFLLLSIGVLYYKTGEFHQAVQFTKEALQIIHANADNPGINKTYLPEYYFYLSIYYDSLKLPSKKNEAIDSCISNELKDNSDYHYTSVVLGSNVRDLYEKGDFKLCIDRSSLGESLIHKYSKYNDSTSRIIYFIYYKSSALRALKRFQEEEQFLHSKKPEFLKSKNRDFTGIIYRLYGNMYESRGEYKNAIDYFQKAVYYDRMTRAKQITPGVLDEIGGIYADRLNQNILALKYYYEALSYANTQALANGTTSDSFYILGNIANVYVRMKIFDSAQYFYQNAFNIIKPGINETDLVSDIENFVLANSVQTVIKLVLDKANAYLQQYKTDKNLQTLRHALAIYKTSDHLMSKIKEDQSEIQSRLFWQEDTHSLYEHAIEAAFMENDFKEAFYFFEKSRAVQLAEQLRQQTKISDSDFLNQAHLRKQIIDLERERDQPDVSSKTYIDIQKQLIFNKQELERLELDVKNAIPLYYRTL